MIRALPVSKQPLETKKKNFLLIFTDGACSGNPGPGGWGAIILTPADEVFELGGSELHTTNNRMELLAAIQGLEKARGWVDQEDQPIQVLTDSTYVISGITRWIWGWLKKDWLTAEGKAVVNVDLWKLLLKATQNRKIVWKHVRGHVGIVGNERADEIAVQFCRQRSADLYRGSLQEYGIDLRNVPENYEAEVGKSPKNAVKIGPSSKSTKKAYSYLSLIGGTPQRHTTWVECERRVKGQPGARFKKAVSAEDELAILKSWGFSNGLA